MKSNLQSRVETLESQLNASVASEKELKARFRKAKAELLEARDKKRLAEEGVATKVKRLKNQVAKLEKRLVL